MGVLTKIFFLLCVLLLLSISTSVSEPLAMSHSAEVRKYLADKAVAALLERFMAEVITYRPDDVLGFLKQWATEQHALAIGVADAETENARASSEQDATQSPDAGSGEGQNGEGGDAAPSTVTDNEPAPQEVDLRDPLEVVSESWQTHIRPQQLQRAVLETFFQMLFLQKPLLKRTLFTDVDAESAIERLLPVVDAAFVGSLHDAQLLEFCKEVAVDKGVEEKHLVTFQTVMHAAVGSKMPADVWPAILVPWNKYLSELKLRIQDAVVDAEHIYAVESSHDMAAPADGAVDPTSDDDDVDRQKKQETRSPEELVQDSWSKLPAALQQQVLLDTFEGLLVQHSILKKGPLEDLSVDQLATLLKPIVDAIAENKLTAELVNATAFPQQAEGRGLKPKHIDYLITATLGALARHFGGRWSVLNSPWSSALTAAGKLFCAAAFPE